jgi:hypothetical protein
MEYFIKRDGKVQGPFTAQQLAGAVKAKSTRRSDMVATDMYGPYKKLSVAWESIRREAYESPSSPRSKNPNPKTKTKKAGKTKKSNESSLTPGIIALLGFGVLLMVSLVAGGGILIVGSLDLGLSGSKNVPVPSDFSPDNSVGTFAWCGTLPETIALGKAFESGNAVRLKTSANALEERLQQHVGKDVKWQLELTFIGPTHSLFRCFRNIGTANAPILIETSKSIESPDSPSAEYGGFILANYDAVMGHSEVGDCDSP